jgi:hypothetical protein
MISPLGGRRILTPALGRGWQRAAAGGFVPTDIAGCYLWLDFSDATTLFTDAGSTPVSSDGDAIYQANDKSGNNSHYSQSDSAKRPLYKTGILNSLSASLFDGSNDCLTRTQDLTSYDKATLFIAYTSSAASTKVFWEHGDKGANDQAGGWSHYHGSSRTITGLIRGTSGNHELVTTSDTITTKGILTTLVDITKATAELMMYVNGGSPVSTDAGNNTGTLGNLRTNLGARNDGASFPFSGYIYEVILYMGVVLGDTDRSSVLTYLNNKWAIY